MSLIIKNGFDNGILAIISKRRSIKEITGELDFPENEDLDLVKM